MYRRRFDSMGKVVLGAERCEALPNHCLVAALMDLGVRVVVRRPGPFWALRDGRRFLAPFGLTLEVADAIAGCPGKYVIWEDGHFWALRIEEDNSLASEPLSPHAFAYKLVDKRCSVHACSPFLHDRLGGARDHDSRTSGTNRTAIVRGLGAEGAAAQLGDDDPARVPVPPDGRCLYYCVVAARNAREWLSSHGANGYARSRERQLRDEADAQRTRELLIDYLRENEMNEHANRLAGESSLGYPEQSDVEYLARFLQGRIILEDQGQQVVYGQGPLLMHLSMCQAVDGDGHAADHFELLQSWVGLDEAVGTPVHQRLRSQTPADACALPRATSSVAGQQIATPQEVTSPIAEQLHARLEIPGAATSETDFAEMLGFLERSATAWDEVPPDPEPVEASIIAQNTALMQAVCAKFPAWPRDLVHLAVGAVILSRMRVFDLGIADVVQLLHCILCANEEFIRAHDGSIYFWNSSRRYWEQVNGLVTYSALQYLKVYILRLEGLYRSFIGFVERREQTVSLAIDAAFRRRESDFTTASEFWEDMAIRGGGTAPPSGKGDGKGHGPAPQHADENVGPANHDDMEIDAAHADGEPSDKKDPWYIFLAKRMGTVNRRLERALLVRSDLQYFCEWCSTPKPNLRGIAYSDMAFEYLDGSTPIRRLTVQERRNVYVSVPHELRLQRLGDPVQSEASRRVQLFYGQTFWANCSAVRVCFAALALAKRGLNIDPVFFLWGPGGVGLSLSTAHLSAMLGSDNHKFFDPQVFFLDEELRKQIELLKGAIVFTAQERPEGIGRGFREDLFKKWASGDGIFGRLPYQIATKVIHLIGWKRMELNRLIKFQGVTEANFHSIFRRSLVIRIKSRFVDEKALDGISPDHVRYGIFPRAADLKEFLQSGAAVLAGLRMQHAFESLHTRAECERLIVDYTYGGADNGETDRYLREACGLSPLTKSDALTTAAAAGPARLPLGVDLTAFPADETSRETTFGQAGRSKDDMRELYRNMIGFMHARDLDHMTDGYFKSVTLPAELKGKGKANLWKAVAESENGRWRNVLSASLTKARVAIFPFIRTELSFEDVWPAPSSLPLSSVAVEYSETYDLEALRQYSRQAPHRRSNAQLLVDTLARANQTRRSAHACASFGDELAEMSRKIDAGEKALDHLEELLEDANPDDMRAHSPKRRRASEPRQTPTPCLVNRTVRYAYRIGEGRQFVCGLGAQTFSRRLQETIMSHTCDLDICNAVFALVTQMVDRLRVTDIDVFQEELATLRLLRDERDTLIERDLQLDRSTGKKLLLSALGGARLRPAWQGHNLLQRVRRLSRFLRWLACSCMPDVYAQKAKEGRWAEASTFSVWWQRCEDHVLRAWCAWIRHQGSPRHLSLHFDGVRIDNEFVKNVAESVEHFCELSAEAVLCRTGFDVSIRQKTHLSLLASLAEEAQATDAPHVGAQCLLGSGNCIPLALYRLDATFAAGVLKAVESDGAFSEEICDTHVRDYRTCFAKFNVVWHASARCRIESDGLYLLHCESLGVPHCLGVHIENGGQDAKVYHQTRVYTLTCAKLCECAARSVDTKLHVTFRIGHTGAEFASLYDDSVSADVMNGLADLLAGAGDDSAHGMGREVVSEPLGGEETVHVRQDLLRLLRRETFEYERTIASEVHTHACAPRSSRRFRCDLCPFREFPDTRGLSAHVRENHSERDMYCASGRKQLNIVYALFDDDQLRLRTPAQLLRRAAALIRDSVQPQLPTTWENIDRCLALLLTDVGPTYANADAVHTMDDVRRVGYTYYNKGFADLMLQEALVHNGRARPLRAALTKIFVRAKNPMVGLLPGNVRQWMLLVEDVFTSPFVQHLDKRAIEACLLRREYTHLSIDATIRVLRRVRGQADYRASAATRAAAAIPDAEAQRRVLTVLGRTSAPVGAYIVSDESVSAVCEALAANWSESQRAQVQTVASDNPSGKMFRELKRIFPALTILALDPVHLAMTYEHAHFRKRTPGSRVLRLILAKFHRADESSTSDSWGAVFHGGDAPLPETRMERHYRELILRQSMPQSTAERILNGINPTTPWRQPYEVLKALAAHAAVYAVELNRRTHQRGVSLGRLVWNAAQPARLQWLMNNLRLLHMQPPSSRALIATGTTACEAHHAEMNRWFRNQPEVFAPTVRLQLRVATLSKLLVHTSAMARPTLRQMRPDTILARIAGQLEHSRDMWKTFCAELRTDGHRLRGAALLLAGERARLAQRIRDHAAQQRTVDPHVRVLKRPSARITVLRHRQRGAPTKRTAFTRQRAGSLVPPALRPPPRTVTPRLRLLRKTKPA